MIDETQTLADYKNELFKAIINNNNMEAVKYLKVEKYNFWEIVEDNNFTGINFKIIIVFIR